MRLNVNGHWIGKWQALNTNNKLNNEQSLLCRIVLNYVPINFINDAHIKYIYEHGTPFITQWTSYGNSWSLNKYILFLYFKLRETPVCTYAYNLIINIGDWLQTPITLINDKSTQNITLYKQFADFCSLGVFFK